MEGVGMTEKKSEIFWYTVAFAVIAMLLIFFLWINGKTFVHQGDGYVQYYAVFLYIGKYLREFIGGGGLKLYDFSIGLGESVIESLNYYGFGDPLNLLSLFAIGNVSEYVYGFCILLRIYLSGLGLIFLLKEYKYNGMLVSGGGILYAFSLYSIYQGLWFYTWLDMVYLLPFLILEVKRIIDRDNPKKDVGKFAFLIFVAACSSFYYLYMLTIEIFLYACFYYGYLQDKKLDIHHLVMKAGQVFAGYILGVLSAGVILFPALYGFFHSSRGIGSAEKWQFLPGGTELMENISNLIIPVADNVHSGLALSFFSVLGCIGIWQSKSVKKIYKIALIFLLLLYLSPAFGRMMNGFGYASNRWIYTVYLVITYMTIVVLQKYLAGEISNRYIMISAIVAEGSIIFHFLLNGDKIRSAVYALFCLFIAWRMNAKRLSARSLFLLLTSGVCLNIVFLFGSWRICGYDLSTVFCTHAEVQNITELAGYKNPNVEWERKDTGGVANSNLLTGEFEAKEYLSVLNKCTYDIWKDLLISPGITAVHHLEGVDGRLPIESLLGIRVSQKGGHLVTNPYALPLGFQYSESISGREFINLSELSRQKVLLEKIVLEKFDSELSEEACEATELELPYKMELINVREQDGDWNVDSNSKVILQINSDEVEDNDGEFYVFFSDSQCMSQDFAILQMGDTILHIQNREDNYYTGLEDYLVHVYPDEKNQVEITFPGNYILKLGDVKTLWYSYEGMAEAIEKLKEYSLQDVKIENNKVTGRINAKDGWLLLSIPYSSPWKAYVDEDKMKVQKANMGFMALELTAGEHMIELRYEPWYLWIGVICTLGGALVMIRITFWPFVFPPRKMNKQNKESMVIHK